MLRSSLSRKLSITLAGNHLLPDDDFREWVHKVIKVTQQIEMTETRFNNSQLLEKYDDNQKLEKSHLSLNLNDHKFSKENESKQAIYQPGGIDDSGDTVMGRINTAGVVKGERRRALWKNKAQIDKLRAEKKCFRCKRRGCTSGKCPLLPAIKPKNKKINAHSVILADIDPALYTLDKEYRKKWLGDQDAVIHSKEQRLDLRKKGISISSVQKWRNDLRHVPRPKNTTAKDMAALLKTVPVCEATIEDISKSLRDKPKLSAEQATLRLPHQIRDFAELFADDKGAEDFPPLRDHLDHAINLRHEENETFTPPWGSLYNIFCVDYRGLNAITIPDRYPLPLFKETLRQLSKARWLTKLDVKTAFHKIRIREGDEWMTAFRCRLLLFEWLVTLFGLINAPATFQRYINQQLREHLDLNAKAYMDDILVYTDNEEEHHWKTVRSILTKIKNAGLFLDIDCYKIGSRWYYGMSSKTELQWAVDTTGKNSSLNGLIKLKI
ncbi:hypothetical protein EV44_g3196 [Erysiphe necator]|uniref:Reverse transcriptase domain-containing protein n=1 Tax=Uncinula necator TaxID=52586 RepID=A0A0B1NVX5_UNCNE|nr:hypothetical protein EV44_g3196 [Erysiphe necator]